MPVSAVMKTRAVRAVAERDKYIADPVLFCREALGLELDWWQAEAMREISKDPFARVAVAAARGSGKTYGFQAPLIAWFMACFAPCRVVTTAPTWRQVEQLGWRDLGTIMSKAKKRPPVLPLKTKWELPMDRFAMGVSPEKPDRIEGPHSDNVLIVVDEAKSVTRDIRRRLRGSFSTCKRANEVACSTPWDKQSEFFDNCTSVEWVHFIVPASKSKYIRKEWIERMGRELGEDSPLYRSQVLAEFVDVSDTALIALEWLERARQGLGGDPEGDAIMGVDVARFGPDASVIYIRRGPYVVHGESFRGEDVMPVANRCAARIKEYRVGKSIVDSTGIGSGVASRLRELGHDCDDFEAGAGAVDDTKYKNVRAEAFWCLREAFREGRVDLSMIPEERYRALVQELTTIEYRFEEGGAIQIEKKEKWRAKASAMSEEKVAHSPDDADALSMAFYVPGDAGVWGADDYAGVRVEMIARREVLA